MGLHSYSFLAFLFSMILRYVESTQCLQNCLICSQASSCLQCTSSNYVAISTVPTKGCLPCQIGCLTCYNQISSCNSCSPGYYIQQSSGQCLKCTDDSCIQCNNQFPQICLTCNTGYYLDQVNSNCQNCSIYSHALTCRQNMILSCQQSYYLFNGQSCQPCNSNCKKCSSSTYCLSCKPGFYGYACQSCQSSCQTCINNLTCLTCPIGSYLKNSLCVACIDSHCLQCDSSGLCVHCSASYYLSGIKTCLVLNQSSTLQGCSTYALDSLSNTINCQVCQQNFFLHELTTTNLGKCSPCSLLCSTCTSHYHTGHCTACSSDAFLIKSGVCYPKIEDSESGQKIMYLNRWNNPDSFSISSKKTDRLYSTLQAGCATDTYGRTSSIQMGLIPGDQVFFQVKFGFLIDSTVLEVIPEIIITLNFHEISYGLSPSSATATLFTTSTNSLQSNFQTPTKCSTSSYRYTQIVTFSISSFSIEGSDLLQNNILLFSAPNEQKIYFSIEEILIKYHPCHATCKKCADNVCLECYTEDEVLEKEYCAEKCSEFYYLYENQKQCMSSCPIGTYPSTENEYWICQSCPLQCARCQSPFSCSSCTSNYFLFEETCSTSCPEKYFPNDITARCEPCLSPCSSCLSQSICLSCQSNFFEEGNCVPISGCPSGKYADLETLSCQFCTEPCSTCEFNSDKCLSCSLSFLYENQCLEKCPSGFVNSNDSVCLKCEYPCLQCQFQIENCTACIQGFLLENICFQNCPDGYIEYFADMQCLSCQYPCETCFSTPSKCLSCISGFIYHQNLNKCILPEKCIIDSFTIFLDGIKCISCPQECSECQSWEKCLACKEEYYLFGENCISECPISYFNEKANRLCQKCANECLTCLYSSDYCTSCIVNYRLDEQMYCVIGCQIDQLYPTCELCSYPCYTCQQAKSNCTSCLQNFYFDSTAFKCLGQCLSGFYAKDLIGEKGGVCEPCVYPCDRCVDNIRCTTCLKNSNLYLFITDTVSQSGVCLDQCPLYYYLQPSTLVCQVCIEPCLTCTTVSICTSCINGILDGTNCVGRNQCPYGKYPSFEEGICQNCPVQCERCLNKTTCLSCASGFYLQNYSCILKCPSSKYQSLETKTCELCQFPCQTCKETSNTCLSCKQPTCSSNLTSCVTFYLYSNQCLMQCPSSTFPAPELEQCLFCQAPCKTCQSDIICTSCLQDYYFLNGQCFEECPAGYYEDQLMMQCLKCVYPCKYCLDRDRCQSCVQGLKIDDICLMSDSCPTGKYLVYDLKYGSVCENCSVECEECSDFSDYCKKCQDNDVFLLNGQCLNQCPISYFPIDDEIKYCQRCPVQCVTCSSLSLCYLCKEELFLYNNQCVEKCPPGFYEHSNSTCLPCSSSCKTCTLNSNNCLSCHEPTDSIEFRYFYKFQCLSACPLQTYPDNISRICRSCNFPCQYCINSQQCMKCYTGYYLSTYGQCIEQCKSPMTIDVRGQKCIEECPENIFRISKIKQTETGQQYTQERCIEKCTVPYILSVHDGEKCLSTCESTTKQVYIDENYICKEMPDNLQKDSLVDAGLRVYVDANYSLLAQLTFTDEIFYDVTDIEEYLQLSIIGSYEYNEQIGLLQRQNDIVSQRMLWAKEPIEVGFIIHEQTPNKLTLRLSTDIFTEIDFQANNIIQAHFLTNSNLFLTSKTSKIPLQKSTYITSIQQNSYQPFTSHYKLESNYSIVESYRVFGLIIVGFLLLVALFLFIYNWYAKIYESLHLLQLIFLLSALELRYPPNLYFFLQGFKNSHFYLIGNWFMNDGNPVAESSPRIAAIFTDCNFMRICGHVLCFLLILGIFSLVLFLSKFLPQIKKPSNSVSLQVQKQSSSNKAIKNQLENDHTLITYYTQLRQALIQKFKLIKWSHIHDFFMTITMIVFFGGMTQTHDYHSSSVLQILGILISWIFMASILVYYCFMSVKLYRIVEMSKKDPHRFCDKGYLFRENMMSITESAVHPEELYLNYIRASRILLFGLVIGLWNQYPLFCISFIGVILLCSSIVYLILKPYPDNTQNRLLGFADIFTFLSLLSILIIQSQKYIRQQEQLIQYLERKWWLGLLSIILLIFAILCLLIQLIVSIIRGNEGPQTLDAQQIDKSGEHNKCTPKKLKMIEKRQFEGWSCQQGSGMYFTKYDQKDEIMQ